MIEITKVFAHNGTKRELLNEDLPVLVKNKKELELYRKLIYEREVVEHPDVHIDFMKREK